MPPSCRGCTTLTPSSATDRDAYAGRRRRIPIPNFTSSRSVRHLRRPATPQINLMNGADGNNVFFQVGSSATLGTDTISGGIYLLLQVSRSNNSATVITCGRALARNGAVTLDNNTIDIDDDTPECDALPDDGTVTGNGNGNGRWQWKWHRRHHRRSGRRRCYGDRTCCNRRLHPVRLGIAGSGLILA